MRDASSRADLREKSSLPVLCIGRLQEKEPYSAPGIVVTLRQVLWRLAQRADRDVPRNNTHHALDGNNRAIWHVRLENLPITTLACRKAAYQPRYGVVQYFLLTYVLRTEQTRPVKASRSCMERLIRIDRDGVREARFYWRPGRHLDFPQVRSM